MFSSNVFDSFSNPYYHLGLLAATAIFLLAFLLTRFARSRLRNRVESECWFCQKTTFVPKGSENSFTCETCGQYNGFTEDGDYNKQVPGQHISEQSPEAYCGTVPGAMFVSKSDVLCNQCRSNQSAIVQRLSEFEPTREELWDIELRNYKLRLERIYPLCATCLTKSRRRIKELDAKLLPNYLNWWNSLRPRRRDNNTNRPSSSTSHTLSTNVFVVSGPLYLVFRISSLLCICSLLAGPAAYSVANRHCTVRTDHKSTVLDRLIILSEPKALRTHLFPHCADLLRWATSLDMPVLGQLCFCLLCIVLQSVFIHRHWASQNSSRTRGVCASVLLLDVILLLIVSNTTVSIILQTTLNTETTADHNLSMRFCGYAVVAFMAIPLLFGVCSSLVTWIRFCSSDWKAQKQVLIESWPSGSSYDSCTNRSQLANSHCNFSTRSAHPAYHCVRNSDPLEEFGTRLRVSTDKPLFRPSVFSCPPAWSPRSTASFCTTLTPSTKIESFYSCPALSASNTLPLLRSDGSDASDASEITSVSRLKRKRPSTVCGTFVTRRRKSRRSYRKRSGLLRFCLSLLFGRIETWDDLFAELVCLANALLVGIVIYGMGRLFVQLTEVF
ncbi:hypothetical protein X801_10333 [Opisthorchis viverrini]|uniref:Ima1 N-terminal domain-containing protein n=2 Tax=Opisthorchis viverrini TaxID=6198 RepID=A0A1S8WHX9_OPIVI|nr:hypothetical protein X801_10333 [Opisthorchis viverrini]